MWGCHVQPVCQQCHGTKQDAGNNFDDHHGDGDPDDNEGAHLPGAFQFLTEGMTVLPGIKIKMMHKLNETVQNEFFLAKEIFLAAYNHYYPLKAVAASLYIGDSQLSTIRERVISGKI